MPTATPIFKQVLATGAAALQRFKGRTLNVLEVMKPEDLVRAIHLGKIVSKLSPILANTCELDLTLALNQEGRWPDGTWKRQDPAFPDVIFDGTVTPIPGIEIKVWFPLATEITGRFKESISRFAENQIDVAVIAWLPQSVIFGKPIVLDVWVDSAKSVALARDTHYHNPPDYLIIEPEDTSGRTRNLRQTNTAGYKFQGTAVQFQEAEAIVNSWGPEGRTFAFTPEYQAKLRELRNLFRYRSESNFSKIDRIEHTTLEAFKTRILDTQVSGRTLRQWRTILNRSSQPGNQAIIRTLCGL